MADVKISDMLDAAPLTGAEVVPVLQAGTNKKTLFSVLADWLLKTYAGLTQTGTGAVARTAQDRMREYVSVLDFDTLQHALDTGKSVQIPRGVTVTLTDECNFTAANQVVFGGGSIIQSAANKRILVGSNLAGVGVSGLRLRPGLSHSSARSDAVSLSGCDRFVFEDNTVDWTGCAQAQNGLRAINSNFGKVRGNWFLNAPDTNGVYFVAGGADIALEESSSYNDISGNFCVSGNVYGINITTSTASGTTRGNKVVRNTVKNCTAYGIILYRGSGAVSADFGGNIIAKNNVENITGGALTVDDGSSRWFGAGIYDQDARTTIIDGNVVKNVCQQTNAGSLPMAGISATHVTCTITNNVVETSGKIGFYISSDDASGADPAPVDAVLMLTGNKAKNCTNELYKIYNARRLIASGNSGTTSANGASFTVDTNGDWKTKVVLDGLILDNVSAGVSLNRCSIASVQNAHVENSASTGMSVANTDYLDLGGGSSVKSITGNGLSIAASVADGVIDDILLVSETGFGAVMDGNLKIGEQVVFGTTGSGRWAGSFGGDFRALANNGTPSVKNGKRFETSGTTTISAFTGGEPGQTFTLRSAHILTLTNSSSLVLKGGANANISGGNILTFQCRSNGSWEEIARNF